MLIREEIKGALEAILFVRADKVTIKELVELLEVKESDLTILINELITEYNNSKRGIQIIKVNDGFTMCTKPEFSEILSKLIKPINRRLSNAALETIAIIAYKQPVTKLDIEQIRGVKVDKIVGNLLERGLIKEVGRKEAIGKPVLYGTTDEFLKVFGLVSIAELPPISEE